VHEFNALEECCEVEQVTVWCLSCDGARKPRKSGKREIVDGLACKHGCLGQCGGIQCLNGHPCGHLNIIRSLNVTISGFIFEGYIVNH
jgi:hypothetical protein